MNINLLLDKIHIAKKSKFLRKGQILFNSLQECDVEFTRNITNTPYDCFYSDDLINNCIYKLAKKWKLSHEESLNIRDTLEY
jgi:hypothetical protein